MTQAGFTNVGLYEFLCLSRRKVHRLAFVQQLCRSSLWVGMGCLPIMYFRAELGLKGVSIFTAYMLASAMGAGILAWLKHLQLQQVVGKLDLSADKHDQVSSAMEFLADPDPFKRLALRQAEQWLTAHAAEITCLWKWPKEAPGAAAVFVALLVIWWLTPPSFASGPRSTVAPPPMAVQSRPATQSQPASQSQPVRQSQPTAESQLTQRPSSEPTSGPSSQPNTQPRQASLGPSQTSGQQPGQAGTGQTPGRQPGQSGTGTGQSAGQQPGQAGTGQVAGQQPGQTETGGSLAGKGHKEPLGTPTKRVDGTRTKVNATGSGQPGEGTSSERIVAGYMDDPDATTRPTSGPALPDVEYDRLRMSGNELESLPPNRRALVIRYFRSLRNPAGPSSQPTGQEYTN